MTEVQSALLELAERGNPAGASTVAGRAIAAAMARSGKPRRRWPAIVAAATAAAVALAVAAGGLYVRNKTNDIDRVDLGGVLTPPDSGSTDETNILVVGLDVAPGANEFSRGDSIALVRVSNTQGVTAVLSIPRDLYVDDALVVDGRAEPERINVAASDPRRLVRLVERATGLRIDHYAELTQVGFSRMIDALGGVTVFVPAPVRDRLSGLDLPAGCNHLDSDKALAWDRSRHLEYFENGRWNSDPTGDLGRVQRQQQLAAVALDRLGVTRDPRTVNRLLDVAGDDLRVDSGFPFGRLHAWANATARRDGALTLLTLSTTPSTLPNGAAVLLLDAAELPGAVEAFNASGDDHSNHSVNTTPRPSAASTCAV